MYKCEILADSLNPFGDRLTTFKITFPRIVLSEFNTHRMFSRNSASSRAIPFKKMVKMVEENPFIPIAWQKEHKGIQGIEYFTETKDILEKEMYWITASKSAISMAQKLNNHNTTKQLCNRLLEPFMWHTVIVTSGKEGLDNFFELRCPQYEFIYNDETPSKIFRSKKDCSEWYKDEFSTNDNPYKTDLEWLQINYSQADIHIQAIAELMWDAYNESKPEELQAGEWHIPFGDNIDNEKIGDVIYPNVPLPYNIIDYSKEKVKIATARCARISYETLGDEPKIDYAADLRLHDNLLASGHFSPFEHVARVMSDEEYYSYINGNFTEETKVDSNGFIDISTHVNNLNKFGWCNNFKGFIQYRYEVCNF